MRGKNKLLQVQVMDRWRVRKSSDMQDARFDEPSRSMC